MTHLLDTSVLPGSKNELDLLNKAQLRKLVQKHQSSLDFKELSDPVGVSVMEKSRILRQWEHFVEPWIAPLKKNGLLDEVMIRSDTLLTTACRWGSSSIIKKVLDAGADVNMANKYQQSALMQLLHRPGQYTSEAETFECLNRLIENGADIHHQNQIGQQLIHWASWKGFEWVEWCLAKGANPSASDRDGITPLHYAALMGNIKMAELLIQAGADLFAVADQLQGEEGVDVMRAALILPGAGALEIVKIIAATQQAMLEKQMLTTTVPPVTLAASLEGIREATSDLTVTQFETPRAAAKMKL